MKTSRAKGINVTPLVDVLLILLVVVMLSAPAIYQKMPVAVPDTSLTGSPSPQKSVQISIGPKGELYLQQVVTSKEELVSKIGPSSLVELAVDKSVPFQTVAEVMAAIQGKNPREISLLTK